MPRNDLRPLTIESAINFDLARPLCASQIPEHQKIKSNRMFGVNVLSAMMPMHNTHTHSDSPAIAKNSRMDVQCVVNKNKLQQRKNI